MLQGSMNYSVIDFITRIINGDVEQRDKTANPISKADNWFDVIVALQIHSFSNNNNNITSAICEKFTFINYNTY